MGATVRDVVARELERAVRPDQSRLRVMVATHLQQLLTNGEDTDPIGDLDEDTKALVQALAELDEEYAQQDGRTWTPEQAALHPRDPATGRFLSVVARLKNAIREHHQGGPDPFHGFGREQLRRAARTRGIALPRGASKDDIARMLLANLRPSATPAPVPATNATPDDGLDDLDERDIRDLALEYGLYPNQPRETLIARIREKRKANGEAPTPPRVQPRPGSAGSKLIGNLIPGSYTEAVAREAEIKQIVEERLNGQYAGLTVRVKEVDSSGGELEVGADILDANGRQVGTTQRIFRNTGGKLWVYHAYLSLNRNVQGQGFAEAWNGHLMNWYTESGLDRIEVTANIDVGGYTWARQGFDWKDSYGAQHIGERLGYQLTGSNARRYTAEQVSAAQSVSDRLSRAHFGDSDYPTAYEVSQAGRLPGQGKEDAWPGKTAMLGSTWSGVKPVPASGTAPVS